MKHLHFAGSQQERVSSPTAHRPWQGLFRHLARSFGRSGAYHPIPARAWRRHSALLESLRLYHDGKDHD